MENRILVGGVEAQEELSAGVWHASEQINMRRIDLITNQHVARRIIRCSLTCIGNESNVMD
jgi:hypothetical protein